MGYDPQRKHQRHRVTEEPGPAPVDELLGDEPSPSGNGERAGAASSPTPAETPGASPPSAPPQSTETDPWGSADLRPVGSPDRRFIAIGFALLVVVILVWGRRRRRRRDRD